MNKLLELLSVGIIASLFSIFLMIKEGLSVYPILLFITGIGILVYGLYKKKEISDFDNPEIYDERDETIQNKVSNIVLSILVYTMLLVLLFNSFIEMPLNYVLVLLILFAILGKQLIIKIMETFYDN